MGKIYFIPYEIEKFLHKIDNVLVMTKAVKELNLMNVMSGSSYGQAHSVVDLHTTGPGFVQVLEVLESTWNSSLVFQGLEILEKQHFFGQGA